MSAAEPGRAVVVGGTGCLGAHVCAAFAAAGHEVLVVSRDPSRQVGPYAYATLDVGEDPLPATVAALAGATVVVNATGGWRLTEREMRTSRARMVDRLIEAVARQPSRPRLVHVGTVHEYGHVAAGTRIDEHTTPRPEALYARTKAEESARVLAALRSGRIDGVVLRLANTIGPYPPAASFFGSLAVRLHALGPGEPLDVTIADERRDYVDVRDAAAAVVLAARTTAADPLVNVGRGEAFAVRDLVRALVRAAGRDPSVLREQAGKVDSWSGGADWTALDISRATGRLGWRPVHPVGDSMRALFDTAVAGAVSGAG